LDRKVLSIRRFKAGYEIRNERVSMPECPTVDMRSAYTPDGDYIGDARFAHRIVAVRGIKPEKSDPEHSVCSIGFCEREQKWYGWSHRAIWGFGIGDVAKEGDLITEVGWTAEYIAEHPEDDRSVPVGFTAKTLDDCKRMAIAFADSVS
jgi:hypothetical protein